MDVSHSNEFGTKTKADDSFVTLADLASHNYIVSQLQMTWPELKVISEEDEESKMYRNDIDRFWLIDPLDGTKEFLNGSDEFTVNIALIDHSKAILGFVYAPALDLLYWGGPGLGAYRIKNGIEETIHVNFNEFNAARVVVSRSHLNENTQLFIDRLGSVNLLHSGSSLKFCRIAEGEADIYPRLAPTCEWDTAAAHAILDGAGGIVVDMNANSLSYGKLNVINPSFVAASSMRMIEDFL